MFKDYRATPEERKGKERRGRSICRVPRKKTWQIHSLSLINSARRETGWMRVIPFSSFHPFPSPFFPSPLSDSYTQFFLSFYISIPPNTPPTLASDSPEGAGSRLTSQPARQQPINYEWQVFGPIKAPPYFMHSKSDCRLLWRVAADMFIVVMAVGAEGGEAEGGGSLPNIRVVFLLLFTKAPSLYGGQTDGNSRMRATHATHPTPHQIPQHTHINANSPNIYKEAIFPAALTKPCSRCFLCSHLSPIRTCSQQNF